MSSITLLAIAGLVVVLTDAVQGFNTDFDIKYTSAYRVSFNVSGAENQSAYETIEFDDTYTIETEPPIPMMHNRSFENWYLDPEFTEIARFPLTISKDSATLYPKMYTGTVDDYLQYVYDETGSDDYFRFFDWKDLGDITLSDVVIPDYYYNDGSNGGIVGLKPVLYLSESLENNTNVNILCIGNNITSVPTNFAYNATNLDTIVIGRSVANIYDNAFMNITKATKLVFNAIECSDFEYGDNIFEDLGTESNGVELTIGNGVKVIPQYMFLSNSNIVGSVVIPNSVTSIKHYAFVNMQGITSITIGTSVTYIGEQAFSDCHYVTELNYNAVNCADLTDSRTVFSCLGQFAGGVNLNIGNNVERIPAYLFYSSGYGDYKNGDAPYITGTINIPDSVTTIGEKAFYCSGNGNVDTIVVGKNIASIGNRALGYIKGVTKIYFNAINCGDFVASSEGPFSETTSTEGISVVFGNDIKRIPSALFVYGNNIVGDVVIPDSVKAIGGSVFTATNSGVTSLIIGSGVQTIGGYAFQNFYNITSLTIPENVISIGDYAFANAHDVTSLNYNAISCADFESTDSYVFDRLGSTSGTTINISNKVKRIPAYAFTGSSINIIGTVNIPDSVQEIGSYAFSGLTAITNLTIGKGVSFIGESAFKNTEGLTTIQYNATKCKDLESSNYVFYYSGKSSGSITVTIGANVKRIPAYLFFPYSSSTYRPRITTVTFEDNSVCEYIGAYAFRYCTSLTNVDFGTNTSGWWVSTSATATSGTSISESDLTNTTTAKTRLVTTYYNYYWFHNTNTITFDANGGEFDNPSSMYSYTFETFAEAESGEYVVENVDGSNNYGFSINADGYYESCNQGVKNSYSLAKVSFTANKGDSVVISLINYAESNYDYGIFSNLNTTLSASYSADSSNVFKSYKGASSSSVKELVYNIEADGTHYFYVKFIKDSSTNSNNDSLQFKVQVNNMVLDTTKAYTTIIADYSIGKLPVPVREGYTFLGWSTSSSGTTYIDSTYVVSADTRLYAIWRQN